MSLEDLQKQIEDLEIQRREAQGEAYDDLTMQIEELQKRAYASLTAWDRVTIARSPKRCKASDLINMLFSHFYELHGDRRYGDDQAIIGGIGYYHDIPVTIIAQAKGKTTKENIDRRFGMSNPEGYRKALRLAKQAEKFHRPIITIVDTAGAYPGKEAEERGQAQAIAECLYEFSDLHTPIICIVLSEGGSGGALALSVADRILMMENAVYSILSPEGFASILWKDDSRVKEAAEVMKLTSYDLYNKGIIDYLVKEPAAGIQADMKLVLADIDQYIAHELDILMNMSDKKRLNERYEKFRRIGSNL